MLKHLTVNTPAGARVLKNYIDEQTACGYICQHCNEVIDGNESGHHRKCINCISKKKS